MTMTQNRLLLGALVLTFCTAGSFAESRWELKLTSEHGGKNIPVRVSMDTAIDGTAAIHRENGDLVAIGQFTKPSLLNDKEGVASELHFVLDEIAANEELTLVASEGQAKSPAFSWAEGDGKQLDLNFGEKSVLRYMHEAPDWSSKERLGETYKVYHHVFNPEGKTLLTKGPGGLFPHHRGLFFGFNKIRYGDNQEADIWHCKKNETQEHNKVVSAEAGAVLGRHRLLIDWHGRDKEVFAQEERELTAYNIPGGRLIEFATRLKSLSGPIDLKGDPQHAGFQFRATQHVPDTSKKETYYVRPDGKGEPGKFRNWPQETDHVNLAWNALCMVVEGQRYTVCYLDRPENPKESRFSERDYGRFGSYFEYEVTEEKPLELNYRIWVQNGEMTVEEVATQSHHFVKGPAVTVHALVGAK